MEGSQKCPVCASEDTKIGVGTHHFLESGLDNVSLLNVEKLVCNQCAEEIVFIPNSTQLMQCIAEEIIASPVHLKGTEIRFLRKNLHLKITEFAGLLGVDRVTVSRWENGHEIPKSPMDRLIRLVYGMRAKVSAKTRKRLNKYLEEGEDPNQPSDYVIPFPLQQSACTVR